MAESADLCEASIAEGGWKIKTWRFRQLHMSTQRAAITGIIHLADP
jgi:hypothetical protein